MLEKIENKLVYKISEFLYIDSEGIKQVRNKKAFNPVIKNFDFDNFKSLNEEEIDCCKRYILFAKEKKGFYNNSYSLKHRVEKYFNTYISNGAFIVALLYFDKKVKFYKNINDFECEFLSLKDLKKEIIPNLSYNVFCKIKSY